MTKKMNNKTKWLAYKVFKSNLQTKKTFYNNQIE